VSAACGRGQQPGGSCRLRRANGALMMMTVMMMSAEINRSRRCLTVDDDIDDNQCDDLANYCYL
jgi:hypothetical protein